MNQKASSIIRTKIYCPAEVRGFVKRDRLERELNRSSEVPLTIISAPAGYGKSVLVSHWARSLSSPVAWLSLDEGESSLHKFLAYILASLDSVSPGLCSELSEYLITPDLPPVTQIAQRLINDIDEFGDELFIVLDDYHVIDHASEVHELLIQVLKYSPTNLHLIVATRRDPPLAMAKLRANGQLIDLRQTDLRFVASETAEMLSLALGGEVADDAVEQVCQSVEGWGAGIRLVALAARNLAETEDFLKSFKGGMQHIHEYLLGEVNLGLDTASHRLLLCSALPERFCGPLLHEMIGRLDADQSVQEVEAFIEFIQHNNMFATGLDSSGQWFRYHQLFRDLLLEQIQSEFSTTERAQLVDAARSWFERHDSVDDAIRLLVDQGDIKSVAGTIENHRVAALDSDQWLAVSSWLQHVEKLDTSRWPGIILAKLWCAQIEFKFELISDLTMQLEKLEVEGLLTPFQSGELNYFRGLTQFWSGDLAGAQDCFEDAAAAPVGMGQVSGDIQLYLSLARLMNGDVALAHQGLDAMQAANGGRRGVLASRLLAARAILHYKAMAPHMALKSGDSLATLGASELGSGHATGWGYYLQALTLFNLGRLDEAGEVTEVALKFTNYIEKQVGFELLLIKLMIHALQGKTDLWRQSFKTLKSAGKLDYPTEDSVLASSICARSALLVGDMKSARSLMAHLPHESMQGTQSFWLEEPSVTRIRVMLAAAEPACAPGKLRNFLVKLRERAEKQHLVCQQVDLLLLESVASQQCGRTGEAGERLKQALDLAEPEAWVRPFVELALLLEPIVAHGTFDSVQSAFLARALESTSPARPANGGGANEKHMHQLSPELFTNREIDILELLAHRYRNKEIAEKLYISTHTVNYHLKHIYQKLGVSGRRQAVLRAVETGVIATP